MKPLPLLFLLLTPLFPFAQQSKLDSLTRVAETHSEDSIRAHAYFKIAIAHHGSGDFAAGLEAGQRSLELSRKSGFTKGEASAHYALAANYEYMGEIKHCIDHYRQSMLLAQRVADWSTALKCSNNLGAAFMASGKPDSAISYFSRNYQFARKIDDPMYSGVSQLNLGIIASMQSRFGDALRHLQQGKRHLEGKEELQAIHAATNVSLGTLYHNVKSKEEARGYFDEAIKTLVRCQCNDRALVEALLNRATASERMSEGLQFANRALALTMRNKDSGYEANIRSTMSDMFLKQGQMDSARSHAELALRAAERTEELEPQASALVQWAAIQLGLGNPREARKAARKALEASLTYEGTASIGKCYHILYRSDSALGDFKAAFEHLSRYKFYADSINSRDNSHAVGKLEAEFEAEKKMAQQEVERMAERREARWLLGSAAGGLLLLALVAFTLFRSRRKEKHANAALRVLNEEIAHSKSEIEAMNAELQATLDEVNEQRQKLEEQHEKIEDSIRYASRIQHAILPSETQLDALLPARFIHYQPRDIVSGDFYWAARFEDKTIFAAVDCTGHGVPGAFMSVVGFNLLNQIVNETGITRPSAILNALDRRIVQMLHQRLGYSERESSKDGMDVALIVLHEADASGNRVVEYAGAGRPFWQWRDGQFTEYKSAKYACGGSQHEAKEYPAQRIEARPGDRLYLFSDGVTDQFGGPNGRKLGSAQLQAFLAETAAVPIEEQGKQFNVFFKDWMKAKKQLDDVLLAGVAV